MRARGLARCEGDELDAAIRVECVRECLSERGKAADERLAVLEVRETLEVRVSESAGVRTRRRVRRTGPGWPWTPPQL